MPVWTHDAGYFGGHLYARHPCSINAESQGNGIKLPTGIDNSRALGPVMHMMIEWIQEE